MEKTTKVKENKNIIKLLKKNRKKIFILILLAIIIYVIYMVVQLVKRPTDTVYIEMGKIQKKETAVGYVIREETILKGNNYKNGIEQIKSEGEKVAKGETIFRYYSINEENLIEKIKDLDQRIDQAMSSEKSLPTSDTKALEEQIDKNINELYEQSGLKLIRNNKEEIINDMNKKSKIAGEQSPAGSYLKKLIDERSEYENKLNSGAEKINASVSGVVSYRIDGYEEILSPKDFGKYTKDFLEDLRLKTGQIIPMSNEGGKIVNNYYCYIVSILDSKYAKDIEVGDEVKLKVPSGKEIDATIEYKTNEDDECILTFKIEEEVEELISCRKISFEIIWWSKSGLKVPNQAILTETKGENEIHYVIRTRIGYEDKIVIKILKSNEKYSVVTNYTSEELSNLGFTATEIRNMPNITIYDEVLLN